MSALQIEIPEPCSESWEGMTPTACGRFCNRCQKEVIDITQMDDETILQKYVENGGRLCINARADQITPTPITAEVRVRSFAYARLALFALALWTIFSGGLVREVMAQNLTATVQTQNTDSRLDVTVKDKDGKPVYEARITVLQNDEFVTGTVTDVTGTGSIENIAPGKYRLKISSPICNDIIYTKVLIQKGKYHDLSVNLDCIDLKIFAERERRFVGDTVIRRPPDMDEKITRRYAFDLQGNSWWEERE